MELAPNERQFLSTVDDNLAKTVQCKRFALKERSNNKRNHRNELNQNI